MGEILPDETIQSGYGAICPKCGKGITTNMQGNETGTHECKVENLHIPIVSVNEANCKHEKNCNIKPCILDECINFEEPSEVAVCDHPNFDFDKCPIMKQKNNCKSCNFYN